MARYLHSTQSVSVREGGVENILSRAFQEYEMGLSPSLLWSSRAMEIVLGRYTVARNVIILHGSNFQ